MSYAFRPYQSLPCKCATENFDIPKLAQVIAQDAALSARMVKVANSALYRGVDEVADLSTAPSRLGINVPVSLATAMQQMLLSTSPFVEARMRSNWARCLEVASVSQVLAQHFSRLQPEQAGLAGLVHRIGVLPILAYAEQDRKLQKSAALLDEVIELAHQQIGERVLQHWDFPAALQLVPREYLRLDRVVSDAFCATPRMLQIHRPYGDATANCGMDQSAHSNSRGHKRPAKIDTKLRAHVSYFHCHVPLA